MERFLMFIDGGWVEASGKEYFGVENPATEEVFAEVSSGGVGEVERAVQAAHRAFREWSESSLDDRRSLLRRTVELVEKRPNAVSRDKAHKNPLLGSH